MTDVQTQTQTRPVILDVRIENFPPGASLPSVVGVLDGILALLSVGTVLAPEYFHPTNQSSDSPEEPGAVAEENFIVIHDHKFRPPMSPSIRLPIAPVTAGSRIHRDADMHLNRKGETQNDFKPALKFAVKSELFSVAINYNNFEFGVKSAGWLLDVRRLNYGSPFELTVEAAVPASVAARAVGFIKWIVDGHTQRRKGPDEIAFSEARKRIGAIQIDQVIRHEDAAIREAEAHARIAEAEARLVEMDVEERELRLKLETSRVELERNKIRLSIKEIENELQEKSTLVEAYYDLRSYCEIAILKEWTDEDLAKIAVIPGMREAVRFANVAKLQVKIVDL